MDPGTASAADAYALSRLAFGHDAASLAAISRRSLRGWLDEQLNPDERADTDCRRRLDDLRLPIRYPESKDWSAVDESRPLQWLEAPIEQVSAALADPARPVANQEKARPRVEACAATLLRAVYSRWQLREVLCDFWHDHFSVNAWDQGVGLAFPSFDRAVVRRHAFGNFREMLEAVATSPAMLWYLNNRTSRAGAANENYARELFELHTLGRDAYLNGLYNRWRDVPGALAGNPTGYIDEDVYEAARAFTGWTVEDGSGLGGGQSLPRTGRFVYVESWHDNYQKRVLGREFDPYQPAMKDGRAVLDLAAFHPATATFLARKLCTRLVADHPPEGLVASTARVWSELRERPDQIAQVVAHIARSPEFARARGAKVKRPLDLVASYLRATAIDFTPSEGLIGELDAAGQRLFGWPTPTGQPDRADDWLCANVMRRRWSLVAGLTDNWWHTGVFDPLAAAGPVSAQRFVDDWLTRLYLTPPPHLGPALLNSAGIAPTQILGNAGQARHLVGWAAMLPEYQLR